MNIQQTETRKQATKVDLSVRVKRASESTHQADDIKQARLVVVTTW